MESFFIRGIFMSKKLTRTILILVGVIALGVIVYCGWYIYQYWHGHQLGDLLRQRVNGEAIVEDVNAKTVDIPVDFKSLQEVNPDIYAWVYIPGTDISYPVLQHDSNNSYYCNHAEDGSYFTGGSIYSENYNSKDFTDRMTVIYGHNLRSGRMFAKLNDFADINVFDANRYIYIYMPDKLLVYEIFAVTPHTHEHLLLNHDFNNRMEFNAFFDDVMYKPNLNANYLDDVKLDFEKDRILTLSTCYRLDNQQRCIMMGRLISEIPARK